MTGAPPSDYRLAVPGGWFRIALDPELREKRIAAFVEDRFRGLDERTDRLVPGLLEVLPDLLELDQEPDDIGERRVDLLEDQQQRFPVVFVFGFHY